MKLKMEPAAVSSSTSPEKTRRAPAAESYLHVDPSTYYRNNEELPENFLETISPQQSSSGGMMNEHASSPQLAPLAPMSMASNESGYLGLGMASQYSAHSSLEKTSFGNGPAGLLSPLHLDGRRTIQTRGHYATADGYIKEEDGLDSGQHLLITQALPSQHELDRLDSNETPPAVSNVELASTMIATLIGEQRGSSPSPHSYSQPSSSVMHQRVNSIKHDSEDSLEGHSHLNGDDHDADYQRQSYSNKNHRRVYSTKDTNDPLNAELEDDIYIDTKELCKRIAYELKQHSIPQAIFAERILCRSQGTLSDLLRNPKPWNKLKSGRETFRRMFNWVQQPLALRLGILDMYKHDSDGEEAHTNGGAVKSIGMTPPTPAQNVRHGTRRSIGEDGAPTTKRPRLVFTDIQKRTLQAIFRETQRPSREMQQTIAEHLRLDLSTVANFFMNARRRSRIGSNTDEPQPYQQVRPVTPPPDSPPRTAAGPRRRVPASMQHVEATVSSVADSAIQYSRDAAAQDQLDDDEYKLYKEQMGDGLRGHYEAVDVVHCDSMTSLGDSPVDVVDRGIIKQEEDLEDDSPIAP